MDRAERALLRIERAIERGAMHDGRDDKLRAKVADALAELDVDHPGGRPLMAEVELTIAGRPYKVACRNGEEDTLRAAGALVDAKSREALAGLGTLSESRQLLFAALLLADQIIDGREVELPTGPDRGARRADAASRRTARNHWPTPLSERALTPR